MANQDEIKKQALTSMTGQAPGVRIDITVKNGLDAANEGAMKGNQAVVTNVFINGKKVSPAVAAKLITALEGTLGEGLNKNAAQLAQMKQEREAKINGKSVDTEAKPAPTTPKLK